jgi:hypothetical protein
MLPDGMASTPRGWWEVFLRSRIALLLATAIAALTRSFAAAAGVAYPDPKWSQAWIGWAHGKRLSSGE